MIKTNGKNYNSKNILNLDLQKTIEVWPVVSRVLSIPHTESEYDDLVTFLNELIDEVREDETHPLASLMETVGTLIQIYEDKYVPELVGDPISTLQILMDEHGVKPEDMPELGSYVEVEEIFHRKRDLTIKQIHSLSTRFQVAPAVFI